MKIAIFRNSFLNLRYNEKMPKIKINKLQKKVSRLATKNRWKKFEKPNLTLLTLIIVLNIVGLLMIFSSSAVLANSTYKDPFYFLGKQVKLLILGTILATTLFTFSPKLLKRISIIFLIVGFILLIYLIPQSIFHLSTPGVITLNDATRWIRIPFLFDVQPAEFIKVAIILFTSFWLTLSKKNTDIINKYIDRYKNSELLHTLVRLVIYYLPIIIIGIIGVLVLTEKDLSTVVVMGLTFISIYYVGGTRKEHTRIAIVLIISAIIIGIGATTLVSYRKDRFNCYLEITLKGEPADKQGPCFQLWNGMIGVGSGGLFGRGYSESRQKLFFLQETAYTDSIFAVFAEEFGLFGTILLILAFVYFLSLGFRIAVNSRDKFLGIVAFGITSLICIQAFFNIGANLAVIPFGGIPLPFISYGGSYTTTTFMLIGILLNISRDRNSIKFKSNQINTT